MARITQFFSYLHSILTSIPQHGYHNISRVVQPQIRNISESFTARGISRDPSTAGIELRELRKPGYRGAKETGKSKTPAVA
ncbi:hypothetical protein PV10_00027 [Exophiala mesophila]|uniref:Uncharacterized protein n=1 Tax=Exophiala mesophila TaxID=212818 RepID=A0A0D2AB19_EXOME|nr:uncharacterized protein PV10_00027 [Exophiala mesophila]KIV96123.1 hypothetical protein PV10_00027 [Exophiala mesophila]